MRCESLSLAYIIVPMHTRTSNSGTNMLELLTFYEKNAHACSITIHYIHSYLMKYFIQRTIGCILSHRNTKLFCMYDSLEMIKTW
jgi:hypothetical protein